MSKELNITEVTDLQNYTYDDLAAILGNSLALILRDRLHKLGFTLKDEKLENIYELEKLNLSPRTLSALRWHYKTVDEILRLNAKDILYTRGIGEKAFNEIVNAVHSIGLVFDFEKQELEKNDPQYKKQILLNKKAYLNKEIQKIDQELIETQKNITVKTLTKKN